MKKYLNKFIFIIGLVFLFSGIYRGEVKVVLEKAIRICLECIGIG